MADIFISYSKQQPQPTRDVAAYLTSEGYSVWWDANLTSGELFRDVIDRELDAAKAVIVIWTAHLVASKWVLAEADHADRDGRLIPRAPATWTPAVSLSPTAHIIPPLSMTARRSLRP